MILVASGTSFSSGETIVFAQYFFGLSFSEMVHVLIRKAAHIVEYSVLAYLGWRAHRTMAVPFVIALVVACTDEWLQSRTVGRSGTVWDAMLDISAAAFVVLVMRWRNRRAVAPPPHS
jgi:VanZ family protein